MRPPLTLLAPYHTLPDPHRRQESPEFSIKPGESILDAALRSGVALKYGCRHGNCSSCKYLVTDGEVDYGNASPYSLSNAERDEGWVLLCCATALDDLEIQDDRVFDQRQRPLITPGEFDGRVTGIDKLKPSPRRLRIRTEQPVAFARASSWRSRCRTR